MGTQSLSTNIMNSSLFVVLACLAVSVIGSPAPGGRRPAPRCRTVYETVSSTEYEEQCSTSYEQQCTTSVETSYNEECSTSYEKQCSQASSGYGGYGKQECKQVPKQSCKRVPQQSCQQVPVKTPKQNCQS